jgi:hypothetical protein
MECCLYVNVELYFFKGMCVFSIIYAKMEITISSMG